MTKKNELTKILVTDMMTEIFAINPTWKFKPLPEADFNAHWGPGCFRIVLLTPKSDHPERDAFACLNFLRNNYAIVNDSGEEMYVELFSMNEIRVSTNQPNETVYHHALRHVPQGFPFDLWSISYWVQSALSQPHKIQYLEKTIIIDIKKPMHFDVVKNTVIDKFTEDSFVCEFFKIELNGWTQYTVMIRDHETEGQASRSHLLKAGLMPINA
ncbi:hypothetical protein RYA05_13555 [Pseudomonas syringae pv. actinidiae]|nr:hypothetical protein [Pseudomonas syringae pv. actinidiae]